MEIKSRWITGKVNKWLGEFDETDRANDGPTDLRADQREGVTCR